MGDTEIEYTLTKPKGKKTKRNRRQRGRLVAHHKSAGANEEGSPGHMLKGVNNNRGEVLRELRPFSFAVLDDIVCKIKKGQFARYLG